ncbi:MAG: tRNA (N6-threonylcarbamoyladenosine(37)-N6)-methyltransferase TrmO [Oscillospiraceae bacterium]|nr:tRNA (N6-threonylcarbamoyladenosine(37)-N6)-methyltransferase TrmO [Oscillospiraceae bacterium]
MSECFEMKVIARIENDFREKFGIPRQSGLVPEMLSRIVFEEEYRFPEALRGIEGFSHLWLLWEFSESVRDKWSPTVRPPRLGGNARLGVFATRSPFRPNPLGLSCVGLKGVEHTKDRGDVLIVTGADLLNGTPIFDIKPYIPYADCVPEANGGFTENVGWKALEVIIPPEKLEKVPVSSREALKKVLSNDPRPKYHEDGRIYRMSFGENEIAFTVKDGVLTVTEADMRKDVP